MLTNELEEIIRLSSQRWRETEEPVNLHVPKFADGIPSIKTVNWFNFWVIHSMELYPTNYIHHTYMSVQGCLSKKHKYCN